MNGQARMNKKKDGRIWNGRLIIHNKDKGLYLCYSLEPLLCPFSDQWHSFYFTLACIDQTHDIKHKQESNCCRDKNNAYANSGKWNSYDRYNNSR